MKTNAKQTKRTKPTRPTGCGYLLLTEQRALDPVTSLDLTEKELEIIDSALFMFMWIAEYQYSKSYNNNRTTVAAAERLLQRIQEKIDTIKENRL